MIELSEQNALSHLQRTGRLSPGVNARVTLLEWGVSNVVLRVSPAEGDDFVLKQSRAQLRTRDPWFSRLDRIFREVEVMRTIGPLLPGGVVPRVLFEDRENYLFGMEAIASEHVVWKQALLTGEADLSIAERLGAYLATIHRETRFDETIRQTLGDREVFEQLRIDPFYRRLAEAHPTQAPAIDRLIRETEQNPCCLVLADFSPKNILIVGSEIALVDFETGHYGDPAFDLGFFLSHLLLKTVLHAPRFADYAALTVAFWQNYWTGLAQADCGEQFSRAALTRRTIPHLAGCMWARIDATSKIDYLPQDAQRNLVRGFCRSLFDEPPDDWQGVLNRLHSLIDSAARNCNVVH